MKSIVHFLKRQAPERLIAAGFALVILMGTLLLFGALLGERRSAGVGD